jgi:hypothetical protein
VTHDDAGGDGQADGNNVLASDERVKNYARSTMGEERLSGLAHLYMNRDKNLDCEKVIYEFGKRNHRLPFV